MIDREQLLRIEELHDDWVSGRIGSEPAMKGIKEVLDEVDSSSLELTVKSFCACICHNPKDPCDECKGNHKDPSLEKPHHKEGYDGSDLVGSVASPEKCTLSGCLVVKGTHLPAGKKCLHKHTPDTCEHPYPVDCEKCQDLLARLAAYHAMGGLDKNTSLHGEIEKHLDPQPKCECRSGKLHYANCPEHGFGTKKETPLSKLPSSRIKELVENRNGTMNRAKDWEWVKAILEYLDETHEGK